MHNPVTIPLVGLLQGNLPNPGFSADAYLSAQVFGPKAGSAAGAIFHNLTAGLQGGKVGEYYHLTSAQYAGLVVNVKNYGALGNGSTDDTAAIQSAFDAVEALGGGVVYFPRGAYSITAELTVTESLMLRGDGWGDSTTSASQPGTFLTSIVWDGAAVGTEAMIRVKAIAASTYIYDFGIDGIGLRGNNKSYRALWMSSCRQHRIGRLFIDRCRDAGWVIDDGNDVLGGAYGECDFYYYIAGSNAAAINSNGLKITETNAVGCTSMHFGQVVVIPVNGNGVDIGACDNTIFDKVNAGATGTGYGVLFRGFTDGQAVVSRKNFIEWFSGGTIYAEAESRNTVGWINSEGTKVTLEANTSLDYRVLDRVNGRRWTTANYLTDDRRQLALTESYTVAGTPGTVVYGSANVLALAFAPGATETMQWDVPPYRQWSGGRVTGVTGWGVKSSDTNAGNIVLQIAVNPKGTGSGVGGVWTTENLTHAVDGAGILSLESFEIDFASPVDLVFDSHVLLQFSRIGGDAADTYPDDWALMSICLKYEADVGDSDNPSYRYDYPVDKVV